VELPEIVLGALAGGEAEALAVGRPGVSVAVAEEVERQEAGKILDFPAAGGDEADLALVEVVERAALGVEDDVLAATAMAARWPLGERA